MSMNTVDKGEDLKNLLLQASQVSTNLQNDYRKLADENAVLRQKVAELEGRSHGQLNESRPSTPHSISKISIEVLRMIFAAVHPQADRPHCKTSAWIDAFGAKCAIVRVCRLWYNSFIDRLYEHIHLSRVAQLPRLIRTLETSGTEEMARFILRVDLNLFVPKGWERLYRQDLRRLLSLCPSIREMDHTLTLYSNPQLEPVIYATLAVFLDNVTCLTLGHDEMSFENQCRLISVLTTLRELEFHPGLLDDGAEDYAQKFMAKLPHLSSLTIFLRKGTCRSIRCLTLWTMPSIRRLSVTLTSEFGELDPVQVIQLLPGLCSTHGTNLSFFNLNISSVCHDFSPISTAPIRTNLVTYFPKIEHLGIHPAKEEVLHYPIMPSLRQIDFNDPYCEGLEQHLNFIADSRDSHFPALNVVRILDNLWSVEYFFMPTHFLNILWNWTKVVRTLGIELQNYRGDALEIHRRYYILAYYPDKIIEYEHHIDFEDESDDTYEPSTSEDDDSKSESGDSLSCVSENLEDSYSEPEMDHDTVLRIWDRIREDEGDTEMSDTSE